MFKVSFKETANNPCKVVVKTGRVTRVTLKGSMEIPYFWQLMPAEICEWIAQRNTVELYEDVAKNKILVYSEGISKCKDCDKYDSLLGERLAEARAKYSIYKFLFDLSSKLCNYYNKMLYGTTVFTCEGSSNSLEGVVWKYRQLCDKEFEHQQTLLNKQ